MIREELQITPEALKKQVDVALGRAGGELYVKNVRILDVYTETVYEGSLLIEQGKIVNVNPTFVPQAARVFDGEGLYAVPGFIDPSMHIDCSLVMPNALADGFVPWGTTTVVAEVNDLAGFAGDKAVEAVKAYFKDSDKLPYRLLGLAPGKCVPIEVTKALLDWGELSGQGESFGYTTLAANPDTMEKDVNIRRKKLFLNGHVDPFANTDEIGAFCVCGAVNDHEAWSYEAVFERLRRGVAPQILFSQGSRQLEYMVQEVVLNHHLPTENLLFSADNGYIDDMVNTGLLSSLVTRAIRLGLPPITAIKMASFNVARNLGLGQLLGAVAPGRYADFMLLETLDEIKPRYVFKGGELVAKNGELLRTPEIDYSFFRYPYAPGLADFTLDDARAPFHIDAKDSAAVETLVLKSKKSQGNAQFVDGSYIAERTIPVRDGHTCADLEQDVLKLLFVERYPQAGQERRVISYYVSGFNLKEGALAMNHVAGIHGVLALGTNEEDLYLAIQEVDRHPGALVMAANGAVDAVFPLPYSCMISDLPGKEAAARLNAMTEIVRARGCDMTELWLRFWCLGSTVKRYPIYDI